MKILIIVFVWMLSIGANLYAQNIEARYKVIQNVSGTINGEQKHLATLESSGYFYKKGNRYLYYERPDYLKDYPDGQLNVQTGPNSYSSRELYADSLLNINYKDLDKMEITYRRMVTGKGRVNSNSKQSFDMEFYEWKVLPESKVINGIKCQKASFSINSTLMWVVWFANDIPVKAGLGNIVGVPGLIFEAENKNRNIYYTLESYKVGSDLPESVFELKELKQPTEVKAKLVKTLGGNEKSKIQRQAELTQQ